MSKPIKNIKKEEYREDFFQLSEEELSSLSAGANTVLGAVHQAKGPGVAKQGDSTANIKVERLTL